MHENAFFLYERDHAYVRAWVGSESVHDHGHDRDRAHHHLPSDNVHHLNEVCTFELG